MRRISYALALVGALAATGCGGGADSSNNTGGARGIPGVSFIVTLSKFTGGSVVSGTVAGDGTFTADAEPTINCVNGAGTCSAEYAVGTTVAIKATGAAGSMASRKYYFEGFAGDCAGTGVCTLTGDADRYVSVAFAQEPSAHPNWSNLDYGGAAHEIDLRCANCHGAALQGAGIAPACSKCHTVVGVDDYSFTVDGHFDPMSPALDDHGGWSQGCQRCHTGEGFRDYIGELDGTDNTLSGTFLSNNPITTANDNASNVGAYKWGPLGCNTCHNEKSDPLEGTHGILPDFLTQVDMAKYFGVADANVAGITTIKFPSQLQVTTQKGTGLCGQCHQGRESTASINAKIAAGVASASRGVAQASVSSATYLTLTGGSWTGTNPNTTTVMTMKSTAQTMPTGLAADQYKGYTAIFNGNATKALNGAKVKVASNTGWGGVAGNWTWTITFETALPVVPACAALPNGAGVPSAACDAAVLFPTATGGTVVDAFTATLTDSARVWTVNKWAGYYVYFHTGGNAGRYASIQSNTADTLTVVDNTMVAPAVGDFYQVVPAAAAVQDATTSMSFSNPHYLGAAATVFGPQAAMWFQYPGKVYSNTSHATETSCGTCHEAHAEHSLGEFHVGEATCSGCHSGATAADMAAITSFGDLDGDTVAEAIVDEFHGLEDTLYEALVTYSTLADPATKLCYNGASHPYFFLDTDKDGLCEVEESTSANAYNKFTPRSLRGAFNVKWGHAEPGAWAHNPAYAAQAIIDSIDDLNAGCIAKGSPTGCLVGAAAATHGTRPLP